ncbi:MAG TPA: response regulator [Phenylobacterium sp.]|nr:response regulator [Phenylobacterium sp.]
MVDRPGPERRMVVLVEDDQALASALQFSLRLEGWEVAHRVSGEALLDEPLPQDPFCLVIDIKLPGISGVLALTRLRRRGIANPAILITSDPTPALQRVAVRLRAEIVEKPLISGDLFAAIRRRLA